MGGRQVRVEPTRQQQAHLQTNTTSSCTRNATLSLRGCCCANALLPALSAVRAAVCVARTARLGSALTDSCNSTGYPITAVYRQSLVWLLHSSHRRSIVCAAAAADMRPQQSLKRRWCPFAADRCRTATLKHNGSVNTGNGFVHVSPCRSHPFYCYSPFTLNTQEFVSSHQLAHWSRLNVSPAGIDFILAPACATQRRLKGSWVPQQRTQATVVKSTADFLLHLLQSSAARRSAERQPARRRGYSGKLVWHRESYPDRARTQSASARRSIRLQGASCFWGCSQVTRVALCSGICAGKGSQCTRRHTLLNVFMIIYVSVYTTF